MSAQGSSVHFDPPFYALFGLLRLGTMRGKLWIGLRCVVLPRRMRRPFSVVLMIAEDDKWTTNGVPRRFFQRTERFVSFVIQSLQIKVGRLRDVRATTETSLDATQLPNAGSPDQ